MVERDAYIAFSTFPFIGPVRFALLVKYFGSALKAWRAPISEYEKIGLGYKYLTRFEEQRKTFNLEDYKKKLDKLGIRTVLLTESAYPEKLREIPDPPYLLYIRGKGDFEKISGLAIAVIGARKMTHYGKDVTMKIVEHLALAGVTIVSGLALGIDAVAHEASLAVKGATIAVLGNGLDQIYPPRNTNLAKAILNSSTGILVSEYPLGYPVMPQNFPQRNRIVSGLSQGVLVIEGTTRSGTLLTASAAARQGRDVYAVPGQISSPMSAAPHLLLKEGAKLVEKAEDILEDLDIKFELKAQSVNNKSTNNPEENMVLNAIDSEGMDIDNLVRIVRLPVGTLLGTLTTMELKGMVKNIGGLYVKT